MFCVILANARIQVFNSKGLSRMRGSSGQTADPADFTQNNAEETPAAIRIAAGVFSVLFFQRYPSEGWGFRPHS